jgi:uncharacterized protein (DUF302 family)
MFPSIRRLGACPKRCSEGFGVLTDIDVKVTLKAKLGEEFVPTESSGHATRNSRTRALQLEDEIGTMLPCNVIVQQHADGPSRSQPSIPSPPCRQLAIRASRR